MASVRRFYAAQKVHDADLEAQEPTMEGRLAAILSQEAEGPRGGRYVMFGPIKYLGRSQVDDDFIRNLWTFAASRMGRYARPVR